MNEPKNTVIMDIPVTLTVELGKTDMVVKDIFSLSQGTVIELDKKVDDPVELFVNGRLVARGDVVQVDDSLGIKITEVLTE